MRQIAGPASRNDAVNGIKLKFFVKNEHLEGVVVNAGGARATITI